MFDLVLTTISVAISKSILSIWLEDSELVYATSNSLYAIINTKLLDKLKTRALVRRFKDIEDKIADNISVAFQYYEEQGSNLEPILIEVKDAILRSRIDSKLLTKLSYKPKKLYDHILSNGKINNKHFSDVEMSIYSRMIDLSSQYIINIAPTIPTYEKSNFEEIFDRFDNFHELTLRILNDLNSIIEVKENTMNEKFANFEHDYRAEIARKYDKLEIIGANLNRKYSRYNLSTAYVSLDVIEDSNYEHDDYENYEYDDYESTYFNKLSIDDAFNDRDKILITGEAGSGKSTIMKWLAVQSALGDLERRLTNWGKTIPIVIQLRNYPSGKIDLNKVVEEIAENIVMKIPEDWIEYIFNSGKVLLLVDGLDELKSENRESVYDWIESIIDRYNIKIVLTSRPGANERHDFIYDFEFIEYTISSMSKTSIKEFIQHWHSAVLDSRTTDIDSISNNLYHRIKTSAAIFRLATNPLMCALLCALHHDRNMKLPVNRTSLYEECTMMLLERRDSDRKIGSNIYSDLPYKQKRIIFDHIAYWMLKNNIAVAGKQDLIKVISQKLDELNTDIEVCPKILLQDILERSGMIREIEIGKLDFVHKTFQEYMAASAAARNTDWGILFEKRMNDLWNQTIILSVNFANVNETDCFLTKLLDAKEDQVKSKLLAFQCIETANEISQECKDRVVSEMNEIIPPQNDAEVVALISSGDIASNVLQYKSSFTEKEVMNSIYVLGKIGTESSLSVLETYVNNDLNERKFDVLYLALIEFDFESIVNSNIFELVCEYLKSNIKNKKLYLNCELVDLLIEINRSAFYSLIKSNVNKLKIRNLTEEFNDLVEFIDGVELLEVDGEINDQFIYSVSKFEKLSELVITINDDFNSDLRTLATCINLKDVKVILNSSFCEFLDLSDLKSIPNLEKLMISNSGNFSIDESHMNQMSVIRSLKVLQINSDQGMYLNFVDGGENLVELHTLILHFNDISSLSSLNDLFGIPKLTNLILKISDENSNEINELIETAKMLKPEMIIEINTQNRLENLVRT